MEMSRWTLVAEFDSVQEMIEENDYKGGNGEAVEFYDYVRKNWNGMTDEELDEDTDLTNNTVTITCPTLVDLEDIMYYLLLCAVPKKVELVRNDSRTGM